jgi:hypothetical protein
MVNRLETVKEDINETREIMQTNIQQLIIRGEKLEDLQQHTDKLLEQATIFQKTSKNLSNAYRWAKYKTYAIGGALATGGIGVITTLHFLGVI